MSAKSVPGETIRVFAKSIVDESRRYGFSQLDVVRLINEMMDISADDRLPGSAEDTQHSPRYSGFRVDQFPLRSERLSISLAAGAGDEALIEDWIRDEYGRHFLLSCASAQRSDVASLLSNPQNAVGIVYRGDEPIGAVAFLDIDESQRRAELRKLIGVRSARGQGFAEEATSLWLHYGGLQLGLEKVFVSTLQTHLRNIQLNESIGFRVEGVLHKEARIGDQRYDVLRMGLYMEEMLGRG